jgi:hypothetical protein
MARDHARLLVSIWGDDDWRALPASAQRVYMLAISQPGLSWAGVVPYLPGRWSTHAADTSVASIKKAVAVLEERRFVVVDAATEELFIRTFVKNDNVLRFPNVAINMARAYRQIASPGIRSAFLDELRRLADNPETRDLKGWEQLEVAAILAEGLAP